MRNKSHYGMLELVIGILLVVLGLLTFVHPQRVLSWVVVIYGVLAIISGASDIVFYVKAEQFTGFGPTVSLITGILSIMAGFMLIVYPGTGTYIMVLIIPIWFIAHCISRLSHLNVVRYSVGSAYYWISMILNILGIVLGVMMIIRPYISFMAAGFVIGLYLVITGVDMIVTAAGNMRSGW